MSSPHRSLNAHVPLAPLLRLLGCSVETQAHPLKARCSVCGEGPLILLQDHVCGGSWHCCRQCGSQGDLLALAHARLRRQARESRLDGKSAQPGGVRGRPGVPSEVFGEADHKDRTVVALRSGTMSASNSTKWTVCDCTSAASQLPSRLSGTQTTCVMPQACRAAVTAEPFNDMGNSPRGVRSPRQDAHERHGNTRRG